MRSTTEASSIKIKVNIKITDACDDAGCPEWETNNEDCDWNHGYVYRNVLLAVRKIQFLHGTTVFVSFVHFK